MESVLYLLERIADHMSENDASAISQILEHCSVLLSWKFVASQNGAKQLGKSLMDLLYSLQHLISTGKTADDQETLCMGLALMFMDVTGCTSNALKVLETYAGNRSSPLPVLDRVMQKCYNYFVNSGNPRNLRIHALRCVGQSLAVQDTDYMLKSLDQILIPRLRALQMIVEGRMATSSQSTQSLEEECVFELAVLSALIATQKPRSEASKDDIEFVESSQSDEKSPKTNVVYTILCQCLPLLLNLLRNFSSSEILVEKTCDVLRSGLIAAVQDESTQTLADSYCDILDFIILRHPSAACVLAKAMIFVM
ncbi:unnamed protein product, partial [Gongylonema pulchrum]|uniref:THADA armadillo repeat containing n=1 Tax=Gongylonema pulchrum TaxID=637853 RepID=A0A183EXM5_9BILA